MFTEYLDNKYVSTAITLSLALYAALLGPELPKIVRDLFSNIIFRIAVLFLVVVRGNKDPKMAIMIAVAFVLTLDYLYAMDAKEAFQTIEHMNNENKDQENEEEYEEDSTTENFEDNEPVKNVEHLADSEQKTEEKSCDIPNEESMMDYTGEMEYAQV